MSKLLPAAAVQAEALELAATNMLVKAASIRNNRGTPVDYAGILAARQTLQSSAPMQRSFMQRAADAWRYLISGVGPENFFGPFQPLPPMADVEGPAGAVGRKFDYQVGINTQIQPRSEEAISFGTLRNLADAYDILRLVIETRKDQVASYDWHVIPKDEKRRTPEAEEQCNRVMAMLEKPNREQTWDEWSRAIAENILVVDGNCIYPRRNRGGRPHSLELIDPAMIKRLIDVEGRLPEPPSPAFSQVIKGVPAVDYTSDELVYWMRNPRTWKTYGYSPVEQVIMTVNIALRRQMYQLEYFSEGNIPDALIGVPETWSPEQIKEFQDQFDSLLDGVTATRRKLKFIPEAKSILTPKDATIVLKDDFDEWLARLVCYAFSVPPIPLVKMVNRAAGQQIAENAKEEGLMPWMNWFARRMTEIINFHLDAPMCKFAFKMDEEIDPLIAAQIRSLDVKSAVISIDEAREQTGREKRGFDELLFFTATGPVPLKEAIDRAREDAINPPAPPIFGQPSTGDPGDDEANKNPQPGSSGKKKNDVDEEDDEDDDDDPKAAKKGVHVHMGDTIVRAPSQLLPDVIVNVGGISVNTGDHGGRDGRAVLERRMRTKPDSNGEMVGEVVERLAERRADALAKGESSQEVVRRTVRARRDPKTGEMIGHIEETK